MGRTTTPGSCRRASRWSARFSTWRQCNCDRLDCRRGMVCARTGLASSPPVLVRLVAVLLAGAVGGGCRPESPAARLAHELRGAYPERAAPNGVVRTFDVEAREAELPLVDGGKLRVWAYNGQVPGPEIRIR